MIELESELEELNLIIGYRRSKIIGYSLPKKRSVVLTDKTHAENNGFDQAELMRLFQIHHEYKDRRFKILSYEGSDLTRDVALELMLKYLFFG